MSSYKEGGWDDKYIITKTSGRPIDPNASYFVLRFDNDPHAVVAMEAYANSVESINPEFARDIKMKINTVSM